MLVDHRYKNTRIGDQILNTGKIIVIEGATDGIGKSTQMKLLTSRLTDEDYSITTHHFPSYDTPGAYMVEEYLKGAFGKAGSQNRYFVNTLYAVDRYSIWNRKLKPVYESGGIILLDRYTTSSMIYQATGLNSKDEIRSFIEYIEDYEYNKLQIKKPDLVIFLDADYDVIEQTRMKRKDNDGVRNDIHEKDREFMRTVYKTSHIIRDICGWQTVKCSSDDGLLPREEISDMIYSLVKSIL